MPMMAATAKYTSGGGNKNSQMDAPLVAAFQMQADTIFIISDGYPVFVAVTPEGIVAGWSALNRYREKCFLVIKV